MINIHSTQLVKQKTSPTFTLHDFLNLCVNLFFFFILILSFTANPLQVRAQSFQQPASESENNVNAETNPTQRTWEYNDLQSLNSEKFQRLIKEKISSALSMQAASQGGVELEARVAEKSTKPGANPKSSHKKTDNKKNHQHSKIGSKKGQLSQESSIDTKDTSAPNEQPDANIEVNPQAVAQLQEALLIILSRPDSDDERGPLFQQVRQELLDLQAFENCLEEISKQALQSLKNSTKDKNARRHQITSIYILENLLSEIQKDIPTNNQILKIVQNIGQSQIKIYPELKNELMLGPMRDHLQSPSEKAQQMLAKANSIKPPPQDENTVSDEGYDNSTEVTRPFHKDINRGRDVFRKQKE